MTTIEIITDVFTRYNFPHYNFKNLTKTYEQREYCVQYNETAFSFVSRLLEEEGIFYTFVHTENQHTLTLFDNGFSNISYPDTFTFSSFSTDNPKFTKWVHSYIAQPKQMSMRSFDFKNPDQTVSQTMPNLNAKTINSQKPLERFEHPSKPVGATPAQLNNSLTLAIKRMITTREEIHVSSNYLGLSAGMNFTVTDHERPKEIGTYTILKFHFTATDTTMRGRFSELPSESAANYTSRFQ